MSEKVLSSVFRPLCCCTCGVPFALESGFMEERRKDHATFYCPWGHGNQYRQEYDEAGLVRLNKELTDRIAGEVARHDQTKAELEHTERRRRSEMAAKTRIKNRVSRGVCPCCDRSFTNLRQHMSGVHPDYVAET